MTRIAAIFAHPDDAEIWAGGTIRKHLELGDHVESYVFYELNEIRSLENEKAATILGVRPIYLKTAPYQSPDLEAFIKVLIAMPDIIITHWENDTHLEHQLIFKFSLLVAHYFKRYKKYTPILLMSSTYAFQGYSQLFRPEIIIDIGTQMPAKKAAILCHKSQKPDLILEDIEAQNKILGKQVKVLYAEGFIEYPLFGFKRSCLRNSLGELADF